MRPNAFLRMRDLTDLFSQTLEKKKGFPTSGET